MRIVTADVATVQDGGRPHARRYGFPPSGPLDVEAWTVANAVVGNPLGAAAVEVLAGAFVAELRGRVAIGTFDAGTVIVDGRAVEPWTPVEVDDHVRVAARTTTYVAVAGGIDGPLVVGSRSTIGAPLRPGDVLTVGAEVGRPRLLPRPLVPMAGPLRVVAGPQADRFPSDALLRSTWTVGPEVDRMGVRLAGPSLRASGGELLSDGVVPGSIQVPPDGQPIVILAEGPTTGGYPKIAVIASVDLGRAGRLRPGDEVAFELLSVEEAHALRAAAPDLVAASQPAATDDELLAANLVSGAVDATEEDAR